MTVLAQTFHEDLRNAVEDQKCADALLIAKGNLMTGGPVHQQKDADQNHQRHGAFQQADIQTDRVADLPRQEALKIHAGAVTELGKGLGKAGAGDEDRGGHRNEAQTIRNELSGQQNTRNRTGHGHAAVPQAQNSQAREPLGVVIGRIHHAIQQSGEQDAQRHRACKPRKRLIQGYALTCQQKRAQKGKQCRGCKPYAKGECLEG